MTPRVLGLDISLTRTGVAMPDGQAYTLRPPKGMTGPQRMAWIRDHVIACCEGVEVAVVEAFFQGLKGRTALDLAGVGWIVRTALWEDGVRYVDVPPSTLKRFATGKGGADKQAMQMAAVKRLGYDTDTPDDNEVDALWLRAAGLQAYGAPVTRIPQAQVDALKAVTWPRLRRDAA